MAGNGATWRRRHGRRAAQEVWVVAGPCKAGGGTLRHGGATSSALEPAWPAVMPPRGSGGTVGQSKDWAVAP